MTKGVVEDNKSFWLSIVFSTVVGTIGGAVAWAALRGGGLGLLLASMVIMTIAAVGPAAVRKDVVDRLPVAPAKFCRARGLVSKTIDALMLLWFTVGTVGFIWISAPSHSGPIWTTVRTIATFGVVVFTVECWPLVVMRSATQPFKNKTRRRKS